MKPGKGKGRKGIQERCQDSRMGSQGEWKGKGSHGTGLKIAVKGAEKGIKSRKIESKGDCAKFLRKPNMKSMEGKVKGNEGIEESCRRSGIRNQWRGKERGMR